MAKNRPSSAVALASKAALRTWLTVAVLAASSANAEQTTAPEEAETQNPVNDRNTPAALPASKRLAIQARRVLASIEAPPSPVWIDLADKKALAFWQGDLSGSPEGAILMLHDHGHSPRWPDTLLNLHRTLPRFGWATLSIELPSPAPLRIPARQVTQAVEPQATELQPSDAATEAAKATDTDGDQRLPPEDAPSPAEEPDAAAPQLTAEEVEAEVLATIEAALAYLQQQDQRNVVVMGEGLGAARALKYAATVGAENEAIRALVLVNPRFPATADYQIETLLRQTHVPIMDMITSVDFRVRERAVQRRQVAKQTQHQSYTLRRMAPQAGVPAGVKETELSKAIRGFISRKAPGKQL